MDDWESHRGLLKTLYLVEKKSLGYIIKYMGTEFKFNRSKAQYEAHFKKWRFRKNMNDRDWKRVYKKVHQRELDRHPESSVLFNGVIVPHEKVKKEIARHVPLTYQFTSAQMPMDTPSPGGDVIVCTPPGMYQPPVVGSPYIEPELLDLEAIALSRRYQSSPNLSQIRHSGSVGEPSSMASHTVVIVDGIPFFHFQNIFRSEGVRSGFQKMLTVKDDLCDGLVRNLWPEDSSARDFPSNLSGVIPSTLPWVVDDEIDYIMPTSSPSNHSSLSLYKPFGFDLIQWRQHTVLWEAPPRLDVFQYHSLAEAAIPKLLAMMPLREDDDVQSNAALLLGPPFIRAAHLFVEIGVYLVTNNIETRSFGAKLVAWMLDTVPWSIFRQILSIHLSTISAFSKVAFEAAIRNGDVEIVRDLLQIPLLQAAVKSSGLYLGEAVQKSNFEIVELLLEAGSDPNKDKYDLHGSLPLQLVQNIRIARSLVQAGANINEVQDYCFSNSYALSPLVAAAAKGNFELVQFLIEMGAEVNLPGLFRDWGEQHSVTALTMAVSNGRLDITELLLKHGAHINPYVRAYEELPSNGEASFICPFPSCIKRPDWRATRTVRVLLSLLQIAVALKNQNLVELLVLYGSHPDHSQCTFKEINRTNSTGCVETALQIAVGNGDIEIAEFLLRNGANVNTFGYSARNYPITALFLAIDKCDPQLVNLLLSEGADLNLSYYGSTFLQAARSKSNCAEIVNMLLAKNAPTVMVISNEQRDFELQEAVARRDEEWVKRSLALGGVPNMRPLRTGVPNMKPLQIGLVGWDRDRDISLLHLALLSRPFNSEIFRLIVAATPDLSVQGAFHNMVPLLHQAVELGNLEAVKILIRAGADVNEVYRDQTPLIICAASTEDLTMISLLLSSGADLNVARGYSSFTTALQASLWRSRKRHNDYKVFYFLMSKQASINAPVARFNGLSELAYAVYQGGIEIIQLLLDRGADINIPAGRSGGRTALQVAVSLSNIDIIYLLLDRGADINAPAAESWGMTALQEAVSLSNLDIIYLLLDRGADINAPAAQNGGNTALQVAVSLPNLDVIHLLLDRGADINASGSAVNGETALQAAAKLGHFQLVVLFLQLRADVNLRSRYAYGSYQGLCVKTALCSAAAGGRLDTVQLLLQNGADMDLPENERYNTAIRLAQDEKHLTVVELLEDWPTSEAGREAIAKFGHLYKGAERVQEILDEDKVCKATRRGLGW